MTNADALRELLALLDALERHAGRICGKKSAVWGDLRKMRQALTRLAEAEVAR